MTLTWEGEWAERGYATSLQVERGRTLALVGPNGAGKSTTLALLAGLAAPTRGRLVVGDEVLLDTAAGIDVPAHRRRIGVLGQDPLLFPHLRVRANVEFGPRSAGVSRREARRRADAVLGLLDVAEFADRFPAQLSGGQAARVGLARTLATSPRAVLLDEPFAALDVDVAPRMRAVVGAELARLGVPAILVTHDLLDVLALADDLAVIEAGRIVEHGPVASVLAAPTSAFAARLAGVNHVHGVLTQDGTMCGAGGLAVHGAGAEGLGVGAQVVAVWSPTAVALYLRPPEGSPRNVWPGIVADLVDRGGVVRVGIALSGATEVRISADLSPAAVRDLALAPGVAVHAAVKAQEIHLHPLSPR